VVVLTWTLNAKLEYPMHTDTNIMDIKTDGLLNILC